MPKKPSKTARKALAAVTGKRSRVVIEHILKHGSITTDDLKEKYGYDHPPRAIKDVSDQGIPLVKTMVRKDNGKRMAQYCFGDLDNIASGRRGGRISFTKAFKESLVLKHGGRCSFCLASFESRYLQIDHRIPFAIAGDEISASLDTKNFMLVCGSCNRGKSWSCEHCPNLLAGKDPTVCATCYWVNPLEYTHVATQDMRRLDLTWIGSEISDYEAAQAKAGTRGALPQFVKDAVRRALGGHDKNAGA